MDDFPKLATAIDTSWNSESTVPRAPTVSHVPTFTYGPVSGGRLTHRQTHAPWHHLVGVCSTEPQARTR
jgi:hypothetical protein